MDSRPPYSPALFRWCLLWLLAWAGAFGLTRNLQLSGHYALQPLHFDCPVGEERWIAINRAPFGHIALVYIFGASRPYLFWWLALVTTASTLIWMAGDPEPLSPGLAPLRGRWLRYSVILLAAAVPILAIAGFPADTMVSFTELGLLFFGVTQFSRKIAPLRYQPAYWAFRMRVARLRRANAARLRSKGA